MIKKWTNMIASWLINREVIEEKDKELYIYAIYSAFLSICPVVFAFFGGILIGELDRSLAIITPFAVIRKFSGGYHAKNSKICFMWSGLLLFLCIIFSHHIRWRWSLIMMLIIASLSISYNSPIEHENRKLEQIESEKYKKITMVCLIFFLNVAILCYWFKWEKYSICISISILLTASLQIPCVWQKKNKK